MSRQSPFTQSQLQSIDIAARVSSCLSLSGTVFTLTSYTFCPALRKPFNRLAFCIAIANFFGCLAYSWGIHPIHDERTPVWCQTQGFFIEWFVMTDPLLVGFSFHLLSSIDLIRSLPWLQVSGCVYKQDEAPERSGYLRT